MGRPSANQLVVEIRRAGAAVVVRLAGSADMGESERLKDELEQLADQGAAPIIVDLGDLEFICSAGLGALLSAHARMGHVHGGVRLIHPQPFVLRILETTRLTQLFPVYPNLDDALASG